MILSGVVAFAFLGLEVLASPGQYRTIPQRTCKTQKLPSYLAVEVPNEEQSRIGQIKIDTYINVIDAPGYPTVTTLQAQRQVRHNTLPMKDTLT
jgi:hypothetical protein